MQISAPKTITWWIGLIVGLTGILLFIIGAFVHIPCMILPVLPMLMMLGFVLVTVGFIIYVLGTALKGL